MNSNTLCTKVYVEDKDLVDSGVINLSINHVFLEVQNLTFEFVFEDKKDSGSYYEGGLVCPNHMKITFYNLNNALLSGIIEPIEIGTINKKKLFISLTGLTSGSGRVLFYNIWLSKEVLNVPKEK